MDEKKIAITQEGLARLQSELDHLLSVRRREVAAKIKRAREMGGTENNAEYDDAKNDQAFVEGRILMLENIVRNATAIGSPASPEWNSRARGRGQSEAVSRRLSASRTVSGRRSAPRCPPLMTSIGSTLTTGSGSTAWTTTSIRTSTGAGESRGGE